MSRMPRAGGRYVQPIDANGVLVPPDTNGNAAHGVYELEANSVYFFILGGADAPFMSVHLTGYDSGLIIDSATIQDCNHHDQDVTDHSVVAGEWISEDPTTAFVGVEGTGWSQTNGVVAVAGGNLGGALWHYAETGAFRHRLTIDTGGTGGHVRVSVHGKM